jgi:hypothetical protein
MFFDYYNPDEVNKFCICLDANILYGKAMSQKLPISVLNCFQLIIILPISVLNCFQPIY